MRKRNRNFRPQTQKQIGHLRDERRRQQDEIRRFGEILEASEASHGIYIAALANFMGHDIKNCVQSMDAVLTANTVDELTERHVDSLRQQIDIIRQTIANFSKMMPSDAAQNIFKVHTAVGMLESLTRDLLKQSGVRFTKDLPSDQELSVSMDYHSLLQMLHNLMINAVSHLRGRPDAAVLLKVRLDWADEEETGGMLHFSLYDNGAAVEEKMREKIFEFGVSSTGGSGIGLFHARYVCQLNGGSLDYAPSDIVGYTKCFLASLPITNLDKEPKL